MAPPLQGMKILDFTHLLPGPFATMILADLGAEIIKVENPKSPDLMRFMPPVADGMSAVYAHVNRGKKSLGLDLKESGSRGVVLKLALEYDVVVEQFRPGVMDRLGIGYGDLREANPAVIYASLTGYGQTGSYASRAGHDINYMALSGIESFSGRASAGPALSGIQIADLAGGSQNLAIGLLAAYIKRLRTGEGDRLDVSITDGVFSLSVFHAAGLLAGGRPPLPENEIFNGGGFYDYYRTGDGRYLAAGPLEPKFMAAFCDALGCADLVEGKPLSGDEVRGVKERIARIIASQDLDHWRDVFSRIDACVEPVLTLEEAISSPPLSERGMILHVTNGKGTALKQIANPIVFGGGRHIASFSGTELGSHNKEILSRL